MSALRSALDRLVRRQDLEPEAMRAAFETILAGEGTDAQIGAFLAALRTKGETAAEIAAAASVMRARMTPITPSRPVLDTCGTGGDASGSFNISTTVAFVLAAGGVPVAKHGNRAFSSSAGSADVLEALGCAVDLAPEQVLQCVERLDVGFLFAPMFHGAVRHAGAARKQIGFRSLFNLLGPLSNPANAAYQVLGVYDPALTATLAECLRTLGVTRAMVVAGEDGFDELTLAGPSRVSELRDGAVTTTTVTPEDAGLTRAPASALVGGDARANAAIVEAVLEGTEQGPKRDVVLLNAAAGFVVAGRAANLREGAERAREAIDTGGAHARLRALVALTREFAGR